MIRTIGDIPSHVVVALSGGVDSMAALNFLSRSREGKVMGAFFHHGTDECQKAMEFLIEYTNDVNIPLSVGRITKNKPDNKSLEEHWRDERYHYLESFGWKVITAHTLDDCVETYLHSACHGTPKVIPYQRNNVFRPFLTTRKKDFIAWCEKKNVPWYEDKSNQDKKHIRNLIRHDMIPVVLKVNPGIHKVVKKIVEQRTMLSLLSNGGNDENIG